MKESNEKDFPVVVIASEVAEKVQAIYKKASILFITKNNNNNNR